MSENNQKLSELERASYDKFDSALLTITSGAIALSVSIVMKDISDSWEYFALIKYSWFLWVISLFIQISGHLLAAKAMRIKALGRESILTKGILTYLNWSAFITFLLGVITFLKFVSLNFS